MRPFLFVAGHLLACTLMISSTQASDDPVPGSCPAPRSCGDRDYWTPDQHFEIEATPRPGLPSVPVWSRPPCGVTNPQALLEHARAELLRTFDVRVRDERDIDWHEEVLQDWDSRECVCVTFLDNSAEHNTYSDHYGLDVRVVSGPDWDRSGPQDVLVEVRDNWYPDESARDAPAQKTVTIAVAVCDWAVTAEFQTRIDCDYIGAPALTGFSFFNGGIKTEQSITFQPMIPCRQSWFRYYMDGFADGMTPVHVIGVPQQRYGSTAGFAGFDAPENNCPPCVTVPSPVPLRPVCGTTLPRNRNSWIEMGVGSGDVVSTTFVVNAANPCVENSPPIRANLKVLVKPMPGGPQTPNGQPIGLLASAWGSHRQFPTYELKVNGVTLHLSQHCIIGSTPTDLFGLVPDIQVGGNPLTWVQIR